MVIAPAWLDLGNHSHVASVLFYVEAAVRLKEKKTVTQESADWLLPTPQKRLSMHHKKILILPPQSH